MSQSIGHFKKQDLLLDGKVKTLTNHSFATIKSVSISTIRVISFAFAQTKPKFYVVLLLLLTSDAQQHRKNVSSGVVTRLTDRGEAALAVCNFHVGRLISVQLVVNVSSRALKKNPFIFGKPPPPPSNLRPVHRTEHCRKFKLSQ